MARADVHMGEPSEADRSLQSGPNAPAFAGCCLALCTGAGQLCTDCLRNVSEGSTFLVDYALDIVEWQGLIQTPVGPEAH